MYLKGVGFHLVTLHQRRLVQECAQGKGSIHLTDTARIYEQPEASNMRYLEVKHSLKK